MELFKKLGTGAKFNFKRFESDAQKLRLLKPRTAIERTTVQSKSDDEITLSGDSHLDQPGSKLSKRKRSDDVEAERLHPSPDQLCLLGTMTSAPVNMERPKKKRKSSNTEKTEIQLLAELKQERVNHFRNRNKIHVYGSDVADPVTTIDDLQTSYCKLQNTVVSNVKTTGFESLTPIQMQAIPIMMEKRQILACAPTGSGKTLAFIIPILHHLDGPQNKGFRTVVLSPTRELAKQTYHEFVRISEGTGLRVHTLDNVHKAAKKFGPKSSKKCDILVTTPNKLVFMISCDPPLLSLSAVEWLIIDESDKLFEDGKSGFRDQLAVIYKACDSKDVRRALFSATYTHEVEEWCKLNLDNVVTVCVGAKNSAAQTVQQDLLFVGTEAGKLLAVRDLLKSGVQPPILIFVQSKDRAKELFHELIYDGINVDVIHADRSQEHRDNIVKQFRSGHLWMLICTELMGRGIDFKGVNIVINLDLPNSAISYIHRIGRTGRAGSKGRAITFFTEEDVPRLRTIANVMREAGCPVPDYMLKIRKLQKKQRRRNARSAQTRSTVRTFPRSETKVNHHRVYQHK